MVEQTDPRFPGAERVDVRPDPCRARVWEVHRLANLAGVTNPARHFPGVKCQRCNSAMHLLCVVEVLVLG